MIFAAAIRVAHNVQPDGSGHDECPQRERADGEGLEGVVCYSGRPIPLCWRAAAKGKPASIR